MVKCECVAEIQTTEWLRGIWPCNKTVCSRNYQTGICQILPWLLRHMNKAQWSQNVTRIFPPWTCQLTLLLRAHLLFASFTSLTRKALLGRPYGLWLHCSSSGSEHYPCLRLTLVSWVPLGSGLKRSCRVGRSPESFWDTSSPLDNLHPPFEVIWGNN